MPACRVDLLDKLIPRPLPVTRAHYGQREPGGYAQQRYGASAKAARLDD
jgi:hypothetical protein